MRACNYHCKKAKRTKIGTDWEQYKKLRKLVIMKMKKAKLQYFEKINETLGRCGRSLRG